MVSRSRAPEIGWVTFRSGLMGHYPLLRRLHASWILLGVPVAVMAQEPLQAVTGIVRDTSGKAIGGADVRRASVGGAGRR